MISGESWIGNHGDGEWFRRLVNTIMDLQEIDLHGSAKAMGEAFGEACREETRALYEKRLESAVRFARVFGGRAVSAAQMLALASECLPLARDFDPLGHEEFAGIARGAGMSKAELFFMQGLTDIQDVLAFGPPAELEGCSSAIVGADRTADGKLLLGQNWDLDSDNVDYVRLVHRRPDRGPETWSVTLTGCLSLIGLNSEGVAVGNTNLRCLDGSLGVQYLNVLHRVLRAETFEEAVRCIRDAPRLSGHYYYVGAADGRAAGLECSARRCEVFPAGGGAFVHCNHAHSDTVRAAEFSVAGTGESTCFREARLERLIEEHEGQIGVEDLKRMFGDHEGGDVAICRHNVPPYGVSTNACVIMQPETGDLHACRGQPHVGTWTSRMVRG